MQCMDGPRQDMSHGEQAPSSADGRRVVDDCIQDGDVVVFDINHGFKVQFVTVSSSSKGTFQMGRTQVPSSELIGHAYGTLFEIDEETDALKAVPYVVPSNEWKEEDHAFARLEGHTTSSGITWSPSNQKLDNEGIEQLRARGVRGVELVKTIEDNSSTFDDKTVLAQKKFRRKKERKHVLVGCAKRPTAKTLSEAFYSMPKYLKRIGHLRPDSLAMALCLANVGAYQRVLVIEQSSGLVAGAVMERLGGYGECCAAHVGKNAPNLSIVDTFHFDERVRGVLTQRPLVGLLEEVNGLGDRTAQFQHKGKRFARNEAAKKRQRAEDGAVEAVETDGQAVETDAQNENDEASVKREEEGGVANGDGAAAAQSPGTKQGRFTSLIITANSFSQKSLLLSALPLLAPSASFAVVSLALQPLVDTMNLLRVRGFAVGTAINEPWQRTIQVLPKRTHPDMNMDHGGGYILSGTVTKRGRWIHLAQFRADQGA